MAPPVIFLTLLIVLALIVAGMFVAGIGPFAARKGREPGLPDEPEEEPGERPVHKVPHPRQRARERWEIFPPAS